MKKNGFMPNSDNQLIETIWATLKEASLLKTRRFNPKMILQLGKRTPRQIIENGKISEELGCLDKAVVIGALMQQKGLQTWIVAEQAHFNGVRTLMHFCVQVTDGQNRFTIDPQPDKNLIIEGWPEKRAIESQARKKKTTIVYTKRFRKLLPKNAMNITAFQLSGIKNRSHYIRLSRPKLVQTVKLLFQNRRRSPK